MYKRGKVKRSWFGTVHERYCQHFSNAHHMHTCTSRPNCSAYICAWSNCPLRSNDASLQTTETQQSSFVAWVTISVNSENRGQRFLVTIPALISFPTCSVRSNHETGNSTPWRDLEHNVHFYKEILVFCIQSELHFRDGFHHTDVTIFSSLEMCSVSCSMSSWNFIQHFDFETLEIVHHPLQKHAPMK